MKTIIILFALLYSFQAHAQSSDAPNLNYFKVFILNDNNETLLVEYKGVWEPIGGSYNTTITMEEYVNELSMTANIPANDIRLRGLFSAYYNRSSKPIVYHYYTVRYKSGEIKTPDGCTAVKWVNLEEAKKIMTFDDMVRIYEKILENDNLWGGSYSVVKDASKGTRDVTQIVDFFKLN